MFIYIFLFIFFIFTFLIQCVLFGFLQLNGYELQAKARSGDNQSKKLYPLHQQSYQLLVLIVFKSLLIHLFLLFLILVFLPTISALLLVILLTAVIMLFTSFILPMFYADQVGLKLLAWKSEWVNKALRYTAPATKPLGNLLEKRIDMKEPRLLGSKKELYRLLEKHTESEDSAIASHEVELVRHALDFGEKYVKDYMTPRRVVKRVSAADDIGPILVDELHKSGHSRFPVYDDKQVDTFVGVLFLRDLIDVQSGGSVKQFMQKTPHYIHEDESLYYALQVILQTNQQLLLVVNTFEEFVGVISIEDVLEQIIGAEIVDEFDQHDDLRAVAARMAEKEFIKHDTKRAITDKK